IRRWAGRLGIGEAAAVSVLGDGADWIWKQTDKQLPGARGLLDIYHASEHLAGCARALYGEGAAAGLAWGGQGREALAAAGAGGAEKRRALEDAARYFERRAEYLGYAERLAQGQSIGSGLVEGACKQVIGRRMKQTGARWRVRRANRMATLCCTFHSDTWAPYWASRLN